MISKVEVEVEVTGERDRASRLFKSGVEKEIGIGVYRSGEWEGGKGRRGRSGR